MEAACDTVEDASHRPHQLQTTPSPAQEHIVVYPRTALQLPLDDLLVVTREFLINPATIYGTVRWHRRWISPENTIAPDGVASELT
jgi:hypothetical protein